jgi:GNAT superfamily N-acetyltransferase
LAKFIIRKAELSDAARVAEVHIESWRTTYAGIIPEEILKNLDHNERASRWREIISDPAGKQSVFVVETDDGPIVGFASVEAERSGNPIYDGEISAIYLLREYQRLGIGRRLFLVAAEELSARGFRGLLVRVLAANPSYRFYEALGGLKLDEGKAHIGGVAYPDVAYGWNDIGVILLSTGAPPV